jgi:adenosine deaminase CECR1
MQYADFAHYNQQRDALISLDRSRRPDHSSAVSTAEAKADKIVRELRAVEATSIWGIEHEGIPHPFPGMEFLNGALR